MYFDKKMKIYRQQITINGQRKIFSAKNKKDLMLKMAVYRDNVINHTPTFETVADIWREQKQDKVTPGTWRCYEAPLNEITNHFGKKELKDISGKDVQRYLNSLSLSYKSTLTRKSIISQIFDFAIVDLDMDVKNPCDRVSVDTRLPRSTRSALSDEDVQAIKDTTKDEFILAPLIYYTGMRCGEAIALQFQDIDFKNKTIKITKGLTHHGNQPVISPPKTASGIRIVPLLPQLEALLPKKHRKTDYVVSGEKPLTKSALAKRWEKWEKNHNVKFDRHSIRHTYATMLYESGIDVKAAQRLLGHANFSTTMDVYTHLSDKHLKEASEKLIDFLK